jgi:hypothetical protein
MMSQPISSRTFGGQLKRRWLRIEGSAVRAGLELPIGRTLIALAVAV